MSNMTVCAFCGRVVRTEGDAYLRHIAKDARRKEQVPVPGRPLRRKKKVVA